jgi:hypothetical protein
MRAISSARRAERHSASRFAPRRFHKVPSANSSSNIRFQMPDFRCPLRAQCRSIEAVHFSKTDLSVGDVSPAVIVERGQCTSRISPTTQSRRALSKRSEILSDPPARPTDTLISAKSGLSSCRVRAWPAGPVEMAQSDQNLREGRAQRGRCDERPGARRQAPIGRLLRRKPRQIPGFR